jgi:1-acyl-sn-glycerol-3-phosphate acyltransferase
MSNWPRFCGWLLRKMGWVSDKGPAPEDKCILLGVPHTSFKDFIISYLFYKQYGEDAKVMIKKEFFFWPLGPILRALGGIPVDRSNSTAMLKSLIEEMQDKKRFHLAIAPEGTRKPVRNGRPATISLP